MSSEGRGQPSSRPASGRLRLAVAGAWSLVLALAALGPALPPGDLLSYDLVTVPRQDLLPSSLGLTDALPRAVPLDALVALATGVVPGSVLVKTAVVAALVTVGVGVAALVPVPGTWPAVLAATVAVWNPFVAERLVLGHWALLLGYAVLPWIVGVSVRLRTGPDRRALAVLVLLLAVAAVTPSGGLVAAGLALAVLAWPGGVDLRSVAWALGAAVLVNAPWWVPALLVDTLPPDPRGVEAFAARSEAVGLLPTLLGLGGVWNAEVVPPGRGSAAAVLASALVLTAFGVAGVPALRRALGPGAWGLVALAAAGVAVAWASGVPPLAARLADGSAVPALGLVRDAAKYIGPLAVLWAVTVPAGAARVVRVVGVPPLAGVLLPGVVAAQLLLLPGLAWGVGGRLEPVDYPADWERVRGVLADAPDHGDAVSLPWGAYRSFPWAGRTTVLDPLPRYLPVTVVHADGLPVDGRVVAGESRRARAVAGALGADRPLVETLPPLGVGWVVLASDTPGPLPGAAALDGAREVLRGPSLVLLQLPGPIEDTALPSWAPLVLAVDVLVAVVVTSCAVLVLWSVSRGSRLGRRWAVLQSARPEPSTEDPG